LSRFTGEKPFTCETCGRQFVSRSSMVSHQKKGHKKDKTNPANNADSKDKVENEESKTTGQDA